MKPGLALNGPLKRGDLILDKYEVRGLLGKGGHAFVYDCFNAFLAEEVAIKLIPNLEHRGNQLLKRARGEAQVLYRLNHPNVVRVMDGGEFNGMAYIVMEKLDGISLRQMLRTRGPLPVVEALLIALQVAEALEAAHAMNVIHRDLKPDNIFLLAENHVKVLDFGIAKFLEGYQTTQKDLIQGTAPYMSPEHAQGLGVTFASDIFQLGTILYEMIAGVCPCMIGVEDVTLQELVAIQITKLPPRLKQLVRSVPDYVDRLVWRAIAKQAMQRFPTMAEFIEAIGNALERLDVDLPRERLQRSAAVRRSSSRPPPINRAPDSGVVKTTAFALAAAEFASHPSAPPGAESDPRSDRPIPSVRPKVHANLAPQPEPVRTQQPAWQRLPSAKKARLQPMASDQSARAMLMRAMLIGALAAVPVGVVLGLALRRHAAQTTTTSEPTPSPPVAPSATNPASPSPLPLTSLNVPAAATPAPAAAPLATAHASAVAARPSTKSAARALVARPASGLDQILPQAATTAQPKPTIAPAKPTTALPKPSAGPTLAPTSNVAPKSIF